MKRGKAVLALGVLAGAAALGLGGSMAAKRQPLPLPARYDLREDGAGPWIPGSGGPEHLLGVCVGNGPGDFHEGGRTDPVISGPHDP